jgi:hypothetical protein
MRNDFSDADMIFFDGINIYQRKPTEIQTTSSSFYTQPDTPRHQSARKRECVRRFLDEEGTYPLLDFQEVKAAVALLACTCDDEHCMLQQPCLERDDATLPLVWQWLRDIASHPIVSRSDSQQFSRRKKPVPPEAITHEIRNRPAVLCHPSLYRRGVSIVWDGS